MLAYTQHGVTASRESGRLLPSAVRGERWSHAPLGSCGVALASHRRVGARSARRGTAHTRTPCGWPKTRTSGTAARRALSALARSALTALRSPRVPARYDLCYAAGAGPKRVQIVPYTARWVRTRLQCLSRLSGMSLCDFPSTKERRNGTRLPRRLRPENRTMPIRLTFLDYL